MSLETVYPLKNFTIQFIGWILVPFFGGKGLIYNLLSKDKIFGGIFHGES